MVGGDGLQQIFLDAAGDQVAVEATSFTWPAAITTVPGSHTSARPVDVVQRIAAFRHVDEQDVGLAETDRVWTALRSPPLLTFSGDQPCSTAIGRSSSAVSSSQTKAANGSRKLPGRPWLKGAFISLASAGGRRLSVPVPARLRSR
jgi:hypothetical protein